MAMGIESFLVCSLLTFRDLQKSEKSENRRKAKTAAKSAPLRHAVLSIAREAARER
jgi:hypothetical protein